MSISLQVAGMTQETGNVRASKHNPRTADQMVRSLKNIQASDSQMLRGSRQPLSLGSEDQVMKWFLATDRSRFYSSAY